MSTSRCTAYFISNPIWHIAPFHVLQKLTVLQAHGLWRRPTFTTISAESPAASRLAALTSARWRMTSLQLAHIVCTTNLANSCVKSISYRKRSPRTSWTNHALPLHHTTRRRPNSRSQVAQPLWSSIHSSFLSPIEDGDAHTAE